MIRLIKRRYEQKRLIAFLNDADDARMRALQFSTIKYFTPYATSVACDWVLSDMYSGRELFFGVAHLRKRKWEITPLSAGGFSCIRRIHHDDILCGRGLTIPLGEQRTLQWEVSPHGETFLVERIEVLVEW